MHKAIYPVTHKSSWCGVQVSLGYIFMAWYLVKPRDNSTFTYPVVFTLIYVTYEATEFCFQLHIYTMTP
jgi:hypothetical protein